MESDTTDRRRSDSNSTEKEEEEDGIVWRWDGTNCAILSCSKHRDGSIYSGTAFWHRLYHVADTRETGLEPMMLSNPTDCRPNNRSCKVHHECAMMQIFSLKLARTIGAVDGPVQLYGFFAVRDLLNPLRNYIFNRTRDDPFIVGQQSDGSDSYIQLAGPKRGIQMQARVLVEYDMRIKKGETQEEDLQLIDGAACFSELATLPNRVFTRRIEGDSGAVDITLALFHQAVEATIQVRVLQVHGSGSNLSISSSVSRLPQKIQLFQGVIVEPCDLNRSVIAVVRGSVLIIKLIVNQIDGSGHAHEYCAFKAKVHGYDMQEFKLDFATILLKVSWSTLVSYNIGQGLL